MKNIAFLTLIALSALSSETANAVTPISATITAQTDAVIGLGDYQINSVSTTTFPNILTTQSESLDLFYHEDLDIYSSVYSFVNIYSEWLAPDSGLLNMRYGWDLNASNFGGYSHVSTAGFPQPNWSYTFLATQNGVFNGTLNLSLSAGSPLGLEFFYFNDGVSSHRLFGFAPNPTGTYSFSHNLVAGQTYTLSLLNLGRLSGTNLGLASPDVTAENQSSLGFLNGSNLSGGLSEVTASVVWNVVPAPVPEASTWLMMIFGFGTLGTAIRRKKNLKSAIAKAA